MRGCALPLTKFVPPLPHVAIGIKLKPFTFSIASTHSLSSTPKHPLFLSTHHHSKSNAHFSFSVSAQQQQQQQVEADEEENFQVLTALKTDYNDILIVDTPKSRMLLLDSSYSVHSILYKEQKWTGSYWDEFASLPVIVPKGPIAILGLGGGTAAHLMLDLWPSLQLDGWEIDQILIDKARDYFGLSDLEKTTDNGGVLNVHIGDVFITSEDFHQRYAGIIVDLFSDGKVLPQLQEVSTWLELHERLMANGRFMVNCGGVGGGPSAVDGSTDQETSSDESWLLNPALQALSKAFPGQVSWKRMPKENGENFMALTGPLPDLDSWSASVPSPLSKSVKNWRTLYYKTNRLTDKSDVYSFGVALLEIITSQPVIARNQEKIHISQWVSSLMAKGDIKAIVDSVRRRF
ncbi:putative LRR receptor-like serine/threonine-protein kinase [Glycine soja]